MPRDVSGNYTLPIGNPVVDGTIIDVAWANPTMSDFATQFNNVITRDGVLGATNPIKFASGSAAAPSITFTADPALGLYRAGSNILGFSTAGTARGAISATGNWSIPAPSAGDVLTLTPLAGAIALKSSATLAGGLVYNYTANLSAAALSSAAQIIGVAAGSTGDPYVRFDDTTGAFWSIGADSSDSSAFKISRSALLGGTDYVRISAAGVFELPLAGATLNFTSTGATVGQINYYGTTFFEIVTRNAAAGVKLYVNNGVLSTTWSAAGNVTIAAPSSGAALTINAFAGASAAIFQAGAASDATVVWNLAGSTNQYQWYIKTSNGAFAIKDNIVVADRLSIPTTGGLTIAAPTSGQALTLTGVAAADAAILNGGTSGSFRITERGLPYGTSIHNNAGAVTGTTNQYICSGTYTPTGTAGTNVASVTPQACQWIRVGNVVTVSGIAAFDPTAASTAGTVFTLSLPIASNLASVGDLAGSGAFLANAGGLLNVANVYGDTGADSATFFFKTDTTTGSMDMVFSFQYVVK